MYHYRPYDYVPEPDPVTSDYTILCHYYPGWTKEPNPIHNGFHDLRDYPERTPLLGYYDESLTEVFDWQIKWAVEHGINCFVHCWYRRRENMGKPISLEDVRLSHSIHKGYFGARYKRYMKFAIMWECDWGKAEDENDLTEHLLPFWSEQYFSDECYLRIDGKPALFIYGVKKLIDQLGGIEKTKEAFAKLQEKAAKHGFPGIHVSAIHSAPDIYERHRHWYALDDHKYMGFDSSFQYNWGIRTQEDLTQKEYEQYLRDDCMLDPETVLSFVEKQLDRRIAYDPNYTILTAMSMLDSKPWFQLFHLNPKVSYAQFRLSAHEWKRELEMLKSKIDVLDKDALSRRFIMLDNWNEWSEGHYLAPTIGTGFQYLEALRDVFTRRDNLPDYRIPETLELGPYDEMWRS